ncbi:3306_t:CDS:2 [Funneliformis geosporum]|uniref:5425_t:CDS:1 n=1 Tax=Funneliformis geosporum TaxID=1117311 RepID=A0A9W4SUW2_9GLOM|nr:3306_t:CDS:2 [Funneliformis geosporum]CAI2179982.1 5425_t:CDS:2 [Funneliformis geosporum]
MLQLDEIDMMEQFQHEEANEKKLLSFNFGISSKAQPGSENEMSKKGSSNIEQNNEMMEMT